MAPSPVSPEDIRNVPRSAPEGVALWEARYGMLDGWRGLAAIAVVMHHLGYQTGLPFLSDYHLGHWAVMLFFVISGYCIAAASDSCLRKGLTFRTFMWRRVRRIYPPYLLAVAYFGVTRIAKLALTGVNDISTSPLRWVQNLTLTQWVTLLVHPQSHAPDNSTNFVAAYWSLGYEEQFYFVMALVMIVAFRTRRSMLLWVSVLLAVAMVWNVTHLQLSYGVFIEYWIHFALGVLVFYRLCRIESSIHRRLVDGFLVALLLGSVWLTWFAGVDWIDPFRPKGGEILAVSAFAILLIVLRPISDRVMDSRVGKALATLGLLTYSLYLVHQCNLFVSAKVASYIVNTGWLSLAIQLGIHVLLAVPFYLICERPFHNKPIVFGLTASEGAAPLTARSPSLRADGE